MQPEALHLEAKQMRHQKRRLKSSLWEKNSQGYCPESPGRSDYGGENELQWIQSKSRQAPDLTRGFSKETLPES